VAGDQEGPPEGEHPAEDDGTQQPVDDPAGSVGVGAPLGLATGLWGLCEQRLAGDRGDGTHRLTSALAIRRVMKKLISPMTTMMRKSRTAMADALPKLERVQPCS